MAAWGGARLDENRGFRTNGAQQWSTDINPMKVGNLAELSKYVGPGAISYKSDIPMYLWISTQIACSMKLGTEIIEFRCIL